MGPVAEAPKSFSPGEIVPDNLYRLTEACKRLGWSATAARTARRKGLAVRYAGGKAYVMGSEIIRHITENGKEHK